MKTYQSILILAVTSIIGVIGLSPVAAADDAKKQAYFSKFDVDTDGQLNIAEYTEMVKKQFANKNKEGAEDEAIKRFRNKDLNGDGVLTFDEFAQGQKGK